MRGYCQKEVGPLFYSIFMILTGAVCTCAAMRAVYGRCFFKFSQQQERNRAFFVPDPVYHSVKWSESGQYRPDSDDGEIKFSPKNVLNVLLSCDTKQLLFG